MSKRKLQLFDYLYQYDFGHEAYLNVLLFKRFNAFEVDFRLDDDAPQRLGFSLQLGISSVVRVYVNAWRMHLGLSIFAFNPVDLDWYR